MICLLPCPAVGLASSGLAGVAQRTPRRSSPISKSATTTAVAPSVSVRRVIAPAGAGCHRLVSLSSKAPAISELLHATTGRTTTRLNNKNNSNSRRSSVLHTPRAQSSTTSTTPPIDVEPKLSTKRMAAIQKFGTCIYIYIDMATISPLPPPCSVVSI